MTLLGLSLSWVLEVRWGSWPTTAGLIIVMVQSVRVPWLQSRGVTLDFTSYGLTVPGLLCGAAALMTGLQLALGPLVDEFPFLPLVGYTLATAGAGLILGAALHGVRRWRVRRPDGAPE